MSLSITAKESIKTALAMTLSYGIALSLGWDKPYWAGFSVAFISLATSGQSLNKGAYRMLGTLMAGLVSLAIIALSPQNRWLFITLLSAWVGFCTYMTWGKRHPVFWGYSGYVCAVVSMAAGPDPVNAFQTAVLRAQETGLGILVYSLVAMLVWPINSRPKFEAAAAKLASTQQQLLKTSLEWMAGKGDPTTVQQLRAREMQEQKQFVQLFAAAETDSYDIWELRHHWRSYQHLVAELSEAMARWRENLTGMHSLDLPGLMPNLSSFAVELDDRLTQIGRMLANQAPGQQPSAVDLEIDDTKVVHLSHFHKAALTVIRDQLRRMESLTRSLFHSAGYIKGFSPAAPELDDRPPVTEGFGLPDPDRAAGAVRVMLIMWIAYLGMIYVDRFPAGPDAVAVAGTFGLVIAGIPQVSIWLLFLPAFLSTLVSGLIYFLVMPQLSSFLGLGALLFGVTFAIYYLLAAPRLNVAKLLAISMFMTVISVSNHQTYHFLVVSTTALMLPVVFICMGVTAYFPVDLRPRQSFLRLLGRYFRSCEYLMDALRQDPQKSESRLARSKRAFHLHEISSLPTKLGVWSRVLNMKALPGTSPQQITAMVTALQGLSYRMQQLVEDRGHPQAPFLVQELRSDVAAWGTKMTEAFRCLAGEPSVEDQNIFHKELTGIMERLNLRIEETVDKAAGNITGRDGENFYRLLGACRGVADALAAYVASAGAIDWAPWREERFY